MDEKYLKNLGMSPHVDEGLWNQLKAKGAAFTQGAKNLAAGSKLGSWTKPGVASTESAKFNSAFKSFVSTALSIIKNFDAYIYPWVQQHQAQMTQAQLDDIQKFETLEQALKSIDFSKMPMFEAPAWFPTFGTVGAAASGGPDNIIAAHKKKLMSAYGNFLGDVKALNIVPDQYIPNKVASSMSGAKEALEALGNVIGTNLIPARPTPPAPAGGTTSPTPAPAPTASASPTPADTVPATAPVQTTAPVSPAPVATAAPAPETPAAPEVPAPAPKPEEPAPKAATPVSAPKLSDLIPKSDPTSTPKAATPSSAAPVTQTPSSEPKKADFPVSKPVASTPPPEPPKSAQTAPSAPTGQKKPAPKLGDLIPPAQRLKNVNSKFLVPNGLLPLSTPEQVDTFYRSFPPGASPSTAPLHQIQHAHQQAMKAAQGTVPAAPTAPPVQPSAGPAAAKGAPTGKNVVAPAKSSNPAVVPMNDPDAGDPNMVIPAHLQRAQKPLLGPDSPEVVDYDLTLQGLNVLAKLLNDPSEELIKAIRGEIVDRNALKAEHHIDANKNPVVHNYSNGSKAYMKLRYMYDKNTDRHSFEGNVETHTPKTENPQQIPAVAEAKSKIVKPVQATPSSQTDQPEMDKTKEDQWHPIFQYDAEDVTDLKGNVPASFDIFTIIRRTNPELGNSIDTALKVVDVNKNYKVLNKQLGQGLNNMELALAPENWRGDRAGNIDPKKIAAAQQKTSVDQNPKPRGEKENPQPDERGQFAQTAPSAPVAKTVKPTKVKAKAAVKKKPVKEGFSYKDFYRF